MLNVDLYSLGKHKTQGSEVEFHIIQWVNKIVDQRLCGEAIIYTPEFKLVKQNWFAKISKCNEEKGLPQGESFLDLQIILWEMRRILTKLRELIWLSFANETLSLSFFT